MKDALPYIVALTSVFVFILTAATLFHKIKDLLQKLFHFAIKNDEQMKEVGKALEKVTARLEKIEGKIDVSNDRH